MTAQSTLNGREAIAIAAKASLITQLSWPPCLMVRIGRTHEAILLWPQCEPPNPNHTEVEYHTDRICRGGGRRPMSRRRGSGCRPHRGSLATSRSGSLGLWSGTPQRDHYDNPLHRS